ncbi:hypothetical protein [Brevibacillus sp. SYSU BS000544]|uniref:hypothetical protein n=1 Tax=Brevibacillus sp. SYSU BS000544 TaxID=3416443 RepID=UPI003CE46FC6
MLLHDVIAEMMFEGRKKQLDQVSRIGWQQTIRQDSNIAEKCCEPMVVTPATACCAV